MRQPALKKPMEALKKAVDRVVKKKFGKEYLSSFEVKSGLNNDMYTNVFIWKNEDTIICCIMCKDITIKNIVEEIKAYTPNTEV